MEGFSVPKGDVVGPDRAANPDEANAEADVCGRSFDALLPKMRVDGSGDLLPVITPNGETAEVVAKPLAEDV